MEGNQEQTKRDQACKLGHVLPTPPFAPLFYGGIIFNILLAE
jgi:hypothetical protein